MKTSRPLDHERRDALVLDNLGLVGHMVKRIASRLPPAVRRWATTADLAGYGRIGLVEAANRYDETKGKFSTYASILIKGRILSAVAEASLIHVPQKDYRRANTRANPYADRALKLESYDGNTSTLQASDKGPEDSMAYAEDVARVMSAMSALTSRQMEVIRLYFFQGLSLSEVGAALGFTRQGAKNTLDVALRKMMDRLKVPDPSGLRWYRPTPYRHKLRKNRVLNR